MANQMTTTIEVRITDLTTGELLVNDAKLPVLLGQGTNFLKALEQHGYGLRPEVLAFAKLMEKKLREHDDERGQSWKHDDAWSLFHRLERELGELYRSLTGSDRVELECADVANFAMMIADVVGGLK